MRISELDVAPGATLYAMAGAVGPGSGTIIAIPIDLAEYATDEYVAAYIKGMVAFARLTEAVFLAERLISGCRERLESSALTDYREDIEKIEHHRGEHPSIDAAISLVESARVRAARRPGLGRARAEIKANYERFFVAVGRRDGFQCVECGSSSSTLQIDHIVALINGGTNDLDNLQLLCPGCNSRKSDK